MEISYTRKQDPSPEMLKRTEMINWNLINSFSYYIAAFTILHFSLNMSTTMSEENKDKIGIVCMWFCLGDVASNVIL